jgi:hypothetical protein
MKEVIYSKNKLNNKGGKYNMYFRKYNQINNNSSVHNNSNNNSNSESSKLFTKVIEKKSKKWYWK